MTDWAIVRDAAFRGVSLGVDEWRLDAGLADVRVVGGLAIAGPGTLQSPVAFDKTVRAVMTKAGVPAAVADAVSKAVWGGWKAWADGVTVPGLPWYPAFFAFPMPVAPPTPNVPTPLASCVSVGLEAMSPGRLAAAIADRLGGTRVSAEDRRQIDALAVELNGAFLAWIGAAMVTMAFGAGAAAVAPPVAPVMPVHGSVINDGRGCLAAAVPFPDRAAPRHR